MTIDATGLAGGLTIDAGFRSRAFAVLSDPDDPVALRGLTIINGKDRDGGGIYSHGTLDVVNCLLLANTAEERGGESTAPER